MNKVSLPYGEYKDKVFNYIRSKYPDTAETIIADMKDGDMVEDLYDSYCSIEQAVEAIYQDYREFNGLDRVSLR